jgi:hypothetical protein
MEGLGRLMIGAGIALVLVGALLTFGSRLPWLRLGRLPGDIAVQREGFSFYMPITTMLLLSALLTLVFWIAGMVRR